MWYSFLLLLENGIGENKIKMLDRDEKKLFRLEKDFDLFGAGSSYENLVLKKIRSNRTKFRK